MEQILIDLSWSLVFPQRTCSLQTPLFPSVNANRYWSHIVGYCPALQEQSKEVDLCVELIINKVIGPVSGHPLGTQWLSTDKPSTDYFGLLGVRGQTGYQIFTVENTHNYVKLNGVYLKSCSIEMDPAILTCRCGRAVGWWGDLALLAPPHLTAPFAMVKSGHVQDETRLVSP